MKQRSFHPLSMSLEPQGSQISSERKPTYQRGMVLVLLLIFVVVGWNYWLPTAEDYFNHETKPPNPPNVDFLAYYRAGQRFEQGKNPYYWGAPDLEQGNYSDYLYPPTFLPFYGQLARLDYAYARRAWIALYGLMFVTAFLSMMASLERAKRLTFLTIGLALTVSSYPLLLHIRNGQSDLLVISVVLIGMTAYWRGWRWLAALCFAVGTLLKVSPALFLITFVVFFADFAFLAAFLGLVIGLVVVSFALVSPALYWDYLVSVLPEVSHGTSYWLNQSILKFIGENPLLAKAVSVLGFLAFTLFILWLSSRFKREDKSPKHYIGSGRFIPEAVFCINLLIILIFVGKAWSMAYVWTILPSALLLTELIHRRARLWYFAVMGFGIFLMTSKVYGYIVLQSLNLIGGILVACGLTYWLISLERVLRKQDRGSSASI
jgi:hypothetical protein